MESRKSIKDVYIYIYVDRGKGKWSRRTKSKKERGTHVRAQFNKRSVPFVPFLARYSPTRSPLLFHPPKPRPRLSPPHSYAEQNADEQPSSNAAHLVFWLRSEPARQISSSRDFYLILPPIQCSKQCSLLSPDRISSSLRRQPISSNIAARYSWFRIILEPNNFRARIISSRAREDEIAERRSRNAPPPFKHRRGFSRNGIYKKGGRGWIRECERDR